MGRYLKNHRTPGACVGFVADVGRCIYFRWRGEYRRFYGYSGGDCRSFLRMAHAFTSPQLPYLPVAELASNSGHLHSLAMSRIQRSYTAEYIFSLKDWVDKLARAKRFCLCIKRSFYDSTAYYGCKPVCEYYIFTLRRILI